MLTSSLSAASPPQGQICPRRYATSANFPSWPEEEEGRHDKEKDGTFTKPELHVS